MTNRPTLLVGGVGQIIAAQQLSRPAANALRSAGHISARGNDIIPKVDSNRLGLTLSDVAPRPEKLKVT